MDFFIFQMGLLDFQYFFILYSIKKKIFYLVSKFVLGQ